MFFWDCFFLSFALVGTFCFKGAFLYQVPVLASLEGASLELSLAGWVGMSPDESLLELALRKAGWVDFESGMVSETAMELVSFGEQS